MDTLLADSATWLPIVFAGLMGVSILIYVVLDGYDLGVGILFSRATMDEKDRMIASIGPFWDANETWLVLAVGLLLVAFPIAHGAILTALYLPVAVMLIGLVLRGVAFEFRAKVAEPHKKIWNTAFLIGSAMTSLSQGFMLGLYVMGLEWTLPHVLFACLIAVCLSAAYGLVGAAWLIYKTEGDLQRRAVRWARFSLLVTALGMAAISLATPFVSPRIFDKWFSMPSIVALAPLPVMACALLVGLWVVLRHYPLPGDRYAAAPFAMTIGVMALGFVGLAYSFYPYVVPDRMTIYDAAAAPESLLIILVGTLVVLPVIAVYTVFAYSVFRGKATELRYD